MRPRPAPDELNDTLTHLLPHRRFEIGAILVEGHPALIVRCYCGRTLPWAAWASMLPMHVLVAWLADHDDERFLTDEQKLLRVEQKKASAMFPFGPFDPGGPFLQPPDGLRAELARGAMLPAREEP